MKFRKIDIENTLTNIRQNIFVNTSEFKNLLNNLLKENNEL